MATLRTSPLFGTSAKSCKGSLNELTKCQLSCNGLVHAGVFYFFTKAGAISALPYHLMSDHVFLGSALIAMLSAEAVLLARDVRSVRNFAL